MAYEFEGVQYGRLRDMREARRARYVQLLEEGLNFTQAAHAVGVSKRTGKVWRNGRTRSNGRNERPLVDWYGGRVKDSTTTVSSRYLSIDERIEIADLSRSGTSVRGIARRLGRSASTVSRELRRNAHPADGGYRPHRADQLAASRRPRPKRRKIRPGTDLYAYVAAGLRRHRSPERISNRLVREYPDNDHMRACHETIYQAVYVQPRGELRRQVGNALRRGRAVRRSRSDGQSRRPRFREPMVMISERPAQIEDRAVPGHWEGDLICGTSNKSAIGTLVERTTRYTVLLALPDGHDAEHVQRAIITKMGQLPAPLLNSLTWDQAQSSRCIATSPRPLTCRSIPATRTAHGSGARTRTPTDCCASTSQKEQTCPPTVRTTSMQWPTSSTTDHAKHWTGPSQANGSSNFSMPWNTLNKAYNHKDVLQRPLESASLDTSEMQSI